MSLEKAILLVAVAAVVIAVGFLVPLGSYTTVQGCTIDPIPTKRLHMILGDSLEGIRQNDVPPPPNVGCSANTKFVLYVL